MEIKKMNDALAEAVKLSPYDQKPLVFGEGNHSGAILVVGEAPGGEEEKKGRPFVGSAGKNLDHFLEILEISREDIYITNVVKIRPSKLSEKTGKPVNRTPDKDEISFFSPYLLKEIDLVKPEYVVTLGNTALQALLGKTWVIGDCHGQCIKNGAYSIFPLYHPASIIYNRALKDTYHEDLAKFRKLFSN